MSEPRKARLPRARLESLSDLIFGLALSVGAVLLIGSPPHDVPGLSGDVLEFGFSFYILVSVWLRYTWTMAYLNLETEGMVRLNLLLLFFVALEPFLFNSLSTLTSLGSMSPSEFRYADFATALYAIDLAGLTGTLGLFTAFAARQTRVPADPLLSRELVGVSVRQGVAAAIFLVSALPVFFEWTLPGTPVPIRFALWAVPSLIAGWGQFRRRAFGDRVAAPGAPSLGERTPDVE